MHVLPKSFVRFVYPFLFDASSFAPRQQQIDAATWNPDRLLWQREEFPTAEMLPHVAHYLNSADRNVAAARLWKIAPEALQSPAGIGAGNNIDWQLEFRGQTSPFRIMGIQLTLFPVGVGFLSCQLQVVSSDCDDWLDFLHYFRYLRRHDVGIAAKRRVGLAEDNTPKYESHVPPLARCEDGDGKRLVWGDIVRGLLATGASRGEAKDWWRTVFIPDQALPYAALFLTGLPDTDDARLLFRLHNFFHSRQEIDPASDELRLDQPHLLPYARRQWWVFSLDGGAFVSCDTPDTPFFRETLPEHVGRHYFVLYLLALHQRFTLMSLSEDVSKHWLPLEDQPQRGADDEREAVFRRIRGALLSFTARSYFAQVMQRRHHHQCYLRWLETFQIERLYDEVRQEVQDMHEYLLMTKTARVERLTLALNVILAISIPPTLILGVLGANTTWIKASVGLAAGLVAGCFLAAWLARDRVRSLLDTWRSGRR